MLWDERFPIYQRLGSCCQHPRDDTLFHILVIYSPNFSCCSTPMEVCGSPAATIIAGPPVARALSICSISSMQAPLWPLHCFHKHPALPSYSFGTTSIHCSRFQPPSRCFACYLVSHLVCLTSSAVRVLQIWPLRFTAFPHTAQSMCCNSMRCNWYAYGDVPRTKHSTLRPTVWINDYNFGLCASLCVVCNIHVYPTS